jgi:CHAP domain
MAIINLVGMPHKPPFTVVQMLAEAKRQVAAPTQNWAGRCDGLSSYLWGYEHSGYPSAIQHWVQIPVKWKRTTGRPPVGSLVFWKVGKYGHVAVVVQSNLLGVKVVSGDIVAKSKISIVPLSLITKKWGAQYLGWAYPYYEHPAGHHSPPVA